MGTNCPGGCGVHQPPSSNVASMARNRENGTERMLRLEIRQSMQGRRAEALTTPQQPHRRQAMKGVPRRLEQQSAYQRFSFPGSAGSSVPCSTALSQSARRTRGRCSTPLNHASTWSSETGS